MNREKNHQPTPTPTKTCIICGTPYQRKRRANGHLEHLTEYATRRTCGRECGSILSKRTNTKPHGPPPCRTCGGAIPKRDGEPSHAWRSRRTCSAECLRENRANAGRATAITNVRFTPEERAERDRARKRKPKPPTPERRVGFERFPTPAGMRPRWVSAVGPSLPPIDWHNGVTRSPLRPPNLAEAIDVHPDLLTALAGLLTDSWVAFSRGSGYASVTERA